MKGAVVFMFATRSTPCVRDWGQWEQGCALRACNKGQYGTDCEHRCSLNCLSHDCNRTTGVCYKCNGLRMGDLCTECPGKKYGDQCESSCSRRCLNQECDASSGKCTACIEGFSGNKCDKGEDSWMTYVLGLFLVFIVVGLGIWYILENRSDTRKKSQRHVESAPEGSKSPKSRKMSKSRKSPKRASPSIASTSTYTERD